MAVDSSFSKSNDIVDSPGSQTTKQAILYNEGNLDDLITDYNAHTHEDEHYTESEVDTLLADLDGDHLDIDFTPSNYTPDATPAEAADVDDLAAHLKGVDDALGSHDSSITALEDGDKLDIDFTPSSYTPDASPAEASDVDDLAAHLKGIDTLLGSHQTVLVALGNNLSQLNGFVASASNYIWVYRNTAMTGWAIDATFADRVLAFKGGTAAYNVTGGSVAGTWTQPNHDHGGTTSSPSATTTTNLIAGQNVASDGHTHTITAGATASTWRPAAAVGTAQYPDV